MIRLKALSLAASLGACLSLAACHSPYVQTDIVNHSGSEIRLVEVDYPDASFGTQKVADGATYHYHFKILGETPGPVSITFTGADNKVHTATGPTLKPGQQGTLTITLDGNGQVAWLPQLSVPK